MLINIPIVIENIDKIPDKKDDINHIVNNNKNNVNLFNIIY